MDAATSAVVLSVLRSRGVPDAEGLLQEMQQQLRRRDSAHVRGPAARSCSSTAGSVATGSTSSSSSATTTTSSSSSSSSAGQRQSSLARLPSDVLRQVLTWLAGPLPQSLLRLDHAFCNKREREHHWLPALRELDYASALYLVWRSGRVTREQQKAGRAWAKKRGLLRLTHFADVASSDLARQLKAVACFRRHIARLRPRALAAQQIVDSGVLPQVVAFLGADWTGQPQQTQPQLQLQRQLQIEAAELMALVCSGGHNPSREAARLGTGPALTRLLASASASGSASGSGSGFASGMAASVQESVARALGCLALDSVQRRDEVLACGAVPALALLVLPLARTSTSSSAFYSSTVQAQAEAEAAAAAAAARAATGIFPINALRALRSLFKGKPMPPLSMLQPALPALAHIVISSASYCSIDVDCNCDCGAQAACDEAAAEAEGGQEAEAAEAEAISPAVAAAIAAIKARRAKAAAAAPASCSAAVAALSLACWSLADLTEGPDERVEAVLQVPGLVARLVELLSLPQPTPMELQPHPNRSIRLAALRTMGNLCSGYDELTQAVIDLGAVPALGNLLYAVETAKEAAWALSNVSAGTTGQIQAIVDDARASEGLVRLLDAELGAARREAAWAVSNAIVGGEQHQVAHFCSIGAVGGLCRALGRRKRVCKVGAGDDEEFKEDEFTSIVLLGIEKALAKLPWAMRPEAVAVLQREGEEQLEELSTHSRQEISARAAALVEEIVNA